MVDGVDIDDVLRKKGQLYNLEQRFREKPFPKFFDNYIKKIDTKIEKTKNVGQKKALEDLRDAINQINERVASIGLLIFNTLPPFENNERNAIGYGFGAKSELYLKAVYNEYRSMIRAMESLDVNVRYCKETFEKLTYYGTYNEIVKQIENVLKYGIVRSEIEEFRNNALTPLQNLPANNGDVFNELFKCVHESYEKYREIRIESHNKINKASLRNINIFLME